MLLAAAENQGIDSDLVPMMATGFCSGVAQTGGMCGALSGAVMALSMVHGRRKDGDDRTVLYGKIQTLVGEFEQKFGSDNCSTLLELELGTEQGREDYRTRGLNKRCEGFVREAARLVDELV